MVKFLYKRNEKTSSRKSQYTTQKTSKKKKEKEPNTRMQNSINECVGPVGAVVAPVDSSVERRINCGTAHGLALGMVVVELNGVFRAPLLSLAALWTPPITPAASCATAALTVVATALTIATATDAIIAVVSRFYVAARFATSARTQTNIMASGC